MLVFEAETHAIAVAIFLHGFNSNAIDFSYKMEPILPQSFRNTTRRLYLNAPLRRISVYGNTWYRSWHNYFSNHGDFGRAIEEEIGVEDLISIRKDIHGILSKQEFDTKYVVGESQGGCVAIDVGLTCQENISVVAFFSQRYSVTPLSTKNQASVYWSESDTVIHPSLTENSIQGLNIKMTKKMKRLQHSEMSSSFVKFMAACL